MTTEEKLQIIWKRYSENSKHQLIKDTDDDIEDALYISEFGKSHQVSRVVNDFGKYLHTENHKIYQIFRNATNKVGAWLIINIAKSNVKYFISELIDKIEQEFDESKKGKVNFTSFLHILNNLSNHDINKKYDAKILKVKKKVFIEVFNDRFTTYNEEICRINEDDMADIMRQYHRNIQVKKLHGD